MTGSLTRQAPVHPPGVRRSRCAAGVVLELGAGGVVGTDGVPIHAQARELFGQQPGADHDVGAGLVEVPLADAETRQGGQVRAVDLHEPDVVAFRALPVREIHGSGVEVRLGPGHGVEQLRRDAVAGPGVLPTGIPDTVDEEGHQAHREFERV